MTTATAAPLFETGLKPVRDTIIVKRLEPEDKKTPGGIWLIGRYRKKSIQAWVIAAGPGRRSPADGGLIPMRVKVGDSVLVDKLHGTDITIKGRRLLVTKDRHIIAIIHDE